MKIRSAALVIAALLTACSALQPTLDERGVVKIDARGTSSISIVDAHAYQDGQELVVGGDAEFPISNRDGIFDGHVDVIVIEPDGNTLAHHDIKITPRRIPKSIGRRAFFVTRFQVIPPAGTTIRISYIG